MSDNSFVMTDEENHFFDLRGYLVVHDVLAVDEIDTCNAAIDHFRDQMVFLERGSKPGKSTALSVEEGRGFYDNLNRKPHLFAETFAGSRNNAARDGP